MHHSAWQQAHLYAILVPAASDPFAKKDWYDIKAPTVFTNRNAGKTLVTRTQGTKVSSLLGPDAAMAHINICYILPHALAG